MEKQYKDLTEKQQKLIDYYIASGNISESARRAGYSKKTADRIGHETLKKLGHLIKPRQAILASKRIADMTEINEFWTAIMRSTTEEAKDRLKASELMAKVQGAFIDRVEISKTELGWFKDE